MSTGVLETAGARTTYDVVGQGPAVLLIHGAEADRRSLAALAGQLARSATVITYDQRDCGDSHSRVASYRLMDLAADAADLLRHLGHARATVVGTSFGGRVAQALCLAHPEVVEKLVLCNTWPLDQLLADLNPDGLARLRALTDGLPHTAPEVARMFYSAAYVDATPACVDRIAARPVNPFTPQRRALSAECHALPPGGWATGTLLVAGLADRVVPTTAMQRFRSLAPQHLFVDLQDVGHSAAVEAPEALAECIRGFV